MSGNSPIKLHVDIDALVALRNSMDSIRLDLGTTTVTDLRTDADAMGGVEVSRAVDSFIDNWHDGRQRIDANLAACVDLLGQAIDAYQTAEQTISKATTGSS